MNKKNVKYGIIGAMDKEIELIKENVNIENTFEKAGATFYESKYYDNDIYFVKCGDGKVNAAVCTQILIDKYNVDYIINTGVAGSLNNDLEIGDIVLSKKTLMHDMDVSKLGYHIGLNPYFKDIYFYADEYLIDLAKKSIDNINKGYKNKMKYIEGTIATGDQFISSHEQKSKILENFNVDCVEMEGAGVAQVCFLNKVPFIIIRSMSDKADDTSKMDYREFVSMASNNSSKIVLEMVKN